MTLDELRRVVLLEATLREILSIAMTAETDGVSVPLEVALEGSLRARWRRIRGKAQHLVGGGP